MAIKPNEWTTNYKTLKNYHYTCFSTGTTCSDVYYIYQIETNSYAHYITLTNGRKVEDALDEMFTNTTNSTAKTQIDNWYNTNLSSYTSSYIEDTIYCNDRRIGSLGGWNPNGGTVNSLLYFGKSSTAAPNLRCSRIQDKLTVSESIGNGNLTYPVGLITKDEIAYAGGAYMTSNNTYYLYNNLSYRSMTPDLYSNSDARVHSVSDSGSIGSSTVTVNTGLRPVISLKSTDVVESGDGTQTNPYVIKTS